MTEKLYYLDPFMTTFTAVVQDCQAAKQGFDLVLDRTAFYPEGGGQPCDFGEIDGIAVTEVHEKDGLILHRCAQAIAPGTTVTGAIDWPRRFDHMQQHSGEHIVSGLICSTFHCDNVGFHMGSDVVTIDFNHELTQQDLQEIEARANQYIYEDHPVEISFPDPQALAALPYRSKKELSGQVRIVTFPDDDCCACCGTHVRSSGQVGIVKLMSHQKFRDGSRLTLLCGRRALQYFDSLVQQNVQITHLLSAKPLETAAAVARLQEEATLCRSRLFKLEEQNYTAKARALSGQGDVLLLEEELSADSVRRLCDAVTGTCGGRCAVFSGGGDTWKYAVGENGGDLREWVKAMNQALHGRGGGKPSFVQGSVCCTQAEIEAFFRQ